VLIEAVAQPALGEKLVRTSTPLAGAGGGVSGWPCFAFKPFGADHGRRAVGRSGDRQGR
jgi:hypothetical protein